MALTFQSPFVQTIKTAAVALTAANTNRLAPTSVTKIATAGADGALLTRLEFMAASDVTATEVQVYVSTDAGATKRLVRSKLMAAQTATTSTARALITFDDISEDKPLYLQAAEEVYVGIGVAQASGVIARASWGNY